MFELENGRKHFYQWDTGQRLIIDDATVVEAHFCNRTDDCSLTCEVYTDGGKRVVDVPNILLQDNWDIRVYAYCGNYTKVEERFEVVRRSKPADYVYTETEVKNWDALEESVVGTLISIERLGVELASAEAQREAAEQERQETAAEMEQATADAIAAIKAANTATIVCENTASMVSSDAAAAMPAVGLVSNIAAKQDGSGWDKITLTHTNRNLVSHMDVVFTQGHKNVVPTAEYIDIHTPTTFDYQKYDNIKLKAGQPYTYVVNFEVYGRDEADTRITSVAYRMTAKSSTNTARDIRANGSYTHVINYTPETDVITTLLCYPNFGNNGSTKVPSKVKTRVMLIEGTYTADNAPAFVPCEKETFTATLPKTITSGSFDWNTGILTDASGTEYQLEPQEIEMLKGYNILWSDTGETALTYIADTKLYIDNRIETLTNAIISLGSNV